MTIEQEQPDNTQDPAPQGNALGNLGGGEQEWQLPEKFAVKNEAGEVDHAASLKTLGKSYSELEKRLGSGDAPPASDADYKVEGIKDFDFDEFKSHPENQAFLKSCHAKGLNNAQLGFILNEYNTRIPEIIGNIAQATTEETVASLKQEFGGDFDNSMLAARKAGVAAGLTDEMINDSGLGNNPTFIKVLAHFGKQLGEDTPPNAGGFAGVNDLESLMKNPAYFDQNHPDHARINAQVTKLYEKGASLKFEQ